jgi:uncharacterized protein (TIGR02246 family)
MSAQYQPAQRQHSTEQTMNSQPTTQTAADEDKIRAIHQRIIDAWNASDSAAYEALFSDHADFIVWDGTHLKGRQEIAAFHRQMFDTVVKGSRLEGEVKFVHFLDPELAVMHSVVRVTLSGHTQASPSRDSMQFIVVHKRDGEWLGRGLMNARRLTMEQQLFLDDLNSLPTRLSAG